MEEISESILNNCNITLSWRGWRTTLKELIALGWEYRIRNKFRKSRLGKLLGNDGVYVYIKHNELSKFGRFYISNVFLIDGKYEGNKYEFELDFLTGKKQIHHKNFFITEAKELTGEDIPALYELILKLQEEYPKKKQHKASAEIIDLAYFMKLAS